MLFKKELEQIAIQAYPDIKSEGGKPSKYVAAAQVLDMKRSGKILVIDVFLRIDKSLRLRFFSDGSTFLAYKEWPANKWHRNMPSHLLENGSAYAEASERSLKIAHNILKSKQSFWFYGTGICSEMDAFARGINEEKNAKKIDNVLAKRDAHFAMFPEYPSDLKEFCETDIFGFTYIFISKINKGVRQAVCGHCGHDFPVPKETKIGESASCPACQMQGSYKAGWKSGGPTDKAKICITYNAQNQLLIRWTKIERTYLDGKVRYSFEDYYKNLYLQTPKGQVIYGYKYQSIGGWGKGYSSPGWEWYRQPNGTVYYGDSYVYTKNLTEVFGNPYYHVDLQAGIRNTHPFSFTCLLDNLKNAPTAEYLFKLGLIVLAAELRWADLARGKSFSEIMGISKQYLPMYRKLNITSTEHKIIKNTKTWVSETSLLKIRGLNPDPYSTKEMAKLLETMSLERFLNYFTKQKNILKRKKLDYFLTLYKDYLSMSETLKVDLSRKSVRFPNNIKESHDLILHRFNQVKHKNEDKKFKRIVKKLYAGMPQFANSEFCIVYPALRSDLIKEGQSLNHCVGADGYYKNHIAGTQMIFFVRKITEPQKPFVTMEVDMQELRIRQLYGYGDKLKNPNVRTFANEFLTALKRQENKVKITVSA